MVEFLVIVGFLIFVAGVIALVIGLAIKLMRKPVRAWMRWKPALGITALGFGILLTGGMLLPPSTKTAAEAKAAPAKEQAVAKPEVASTPPAEEDAEVPVEAEEPVEQAQESQDLAEQEAAPAAAPQPEVKGISVGLFLVKCRSAVKEQLKSPNSARFPSSLDLNAAAREFDDGSWALGSHVDAENAFGAEIRTQFTCTYNPSTEEVTAQITE